MGLYESLIARAEQDGSRSPLAVDWYRTRLRVWAGDPGAHRHIASQHQLVEPTCPVPGPHPVADLHAVCDPDLIAGERLGPRTGRRQAFTGEWYAEHSGSDGETVLVSEDTDKHPHTLVTPDFRSWAVVARETGSLGLLVSRTIRELVREAVVADGALMFHGAAAQRPDGRGVFLAGASSSGKTSSALWLGRWGGRLVGTDRTFLAPTGTGWLAVGLPVSTRLGAGSVEALGILGAVRDRVPVRAINPFRTGAGAVPVHRPEPGTPMNKVWLSNGEVREILGSPFTAATRVDTLVVLERATCAEPRVERLEAMDAAAALRPHLLAPDPDYRSRWLARDASPESAERALSCLSELLRDHTVVRLRWDPSLHCDARLPELLSEMDSVATRSSAAVERMARP
ncbi:hypothetical protein DNK48_09650 [Streptomyces malaysiensis subsp. malaysiensis]|uniref:hypothetical protein n=1 Tax=Streptomyces malaysiensis TaxID=92644 RepID=UPI000BFCE0F3|nr:hypothetical protein [Streptomyces malaysiensis]ATL86859.1 hypothetical protein SMALA_6638 [Streptomyces malaysiensis]QDL69630.1 hypothetical protein DNK48_09650 [Streptomyces malaysiensis]